MEPPQDDNLCLSLHVVGDSETEEPVPLNTIYVSESDCDLITKSWNPIKSILDKDSPDPARITMQLRRSPRLSPLVWGGDPGSWLSRKRKANAAFGLGSSEGGLSGRVLRSGKVVNSTALIEFREETTPVRGIEGGLGSGGGFSSGKVFRSGEVVASTALIEFEKETPVRGIKGVVGLDGGSSSGKVLRSGKVAVARDGLKHALSKLRDNEEGNGTLGGKIGTRKAFDSSSSKGSKQKKVVAFFLGEPVPDVEAREKWKWRYELKVIV